MAYSTGSATDQSDLMSKLSTFAQANGFTQDNYDGTNKFLSLSRSADSLYVTFHWDGSNHIQMWQALGYNGTYAQTPWLQADDSGNPGSSIADPSQGRNINRIGNGTFPTYHFFGYTNPYRIFVVLEYSAGLYRHFGFGKINKAGSWTGGAFVAGHRWSDEGSSISIPGAVYHSLLLDGVYTPSTYAGVNKAGATIHMTGLPNQNSATKWGQFGGLNDSGTQHPGTDTASNPRDIAYGGFRNGLGVQQWGWMLPDLANGFLPIIPIELFYIYQETTTRSIWYYLGNLPDIGHIQLQGISAGQEITVGSDTWIAFPAVRKANLGGANEESENMGLIYKKVT